MLHLLLSERLLSHIYGTFVCAPRDMSAGAATAFRTAADKVLASLY
jgi:hypothetical protein